MAKYDAHYPELESNLPIKTLLAMATLDINETEASKINKTTHELLAIREQKMNSIPEKGKEPTFLQMLGQIDREDRVGDWGYIPKMPTEEEMKEESMKTKEMDYSQPTTKELYKELLK